jgi:hypothetical protein
VVVDPPVVHRVTVLVVDEVLVARSLDPHALEDNHPMHEDGDVGAPDIDRSPGVDQAVPLPCVPRRCFLGGCGNVFSTFPINTPRKKLNKQREF